MIWFLRHGDAVDGSPDFERRLTDKGERQATAAGATLAALGVELDLCLASPRVRALETARLACEALSTASGGPAVEPTVEDRLAGGRFDALDLAAGLDAVLLVGHQPDFSDVVAELTGARIDMKKGGLVGVESGVLGVLLRPKETELIATVTAS